MSGDARHRILGRMRHALERNGSGDAARRTVEAKLAHPAPALVPARGDLDLEARVALFIQQAESVQADVKRVRGYTELPEVIADYLRRHNLPLRLVTAADPDLTKGPWDNGLWDIHQGKPGEDDPVSLTMAFAGIAETGTLMLASDTQHPTTLAFLPETSIVTLSSTQVHRAYEDALKTFRSERNLPRSINLITGPSRSGDIEQTLQLGAHGPKRLLIVLVDEVGDNQPIDDASHSKAEASTRHR